MSVSPDITTPVANPAREDAARLYDCARTAAIREGIVADAKEFRARFERSRIAAELSKGSELTYAQLGDLAGYVLHIARQAHVPAVVEVPYVPAVQSAPVDTTPADGKTISQVAKARVESVREALTANGFKLEATVYEEGTRVVALGEENFQTIHDEVSKLPAMSVFCKSVGMKVVAEKRIDYTVPLCDLTAADDCLWVPENTNALHPTKSSWSQLAASLGFSDGAGYLWNTAPPQVKHDAMKAHLARTVAAEPGTVVVLRTAEYKPGVRSIYGQVSTKYATVDTTEVLGLVMEALGQDVHVEGHYGEGKGKLTAIFMPDTIQDLACGDVFKSAVSIQWNDRGTGSISISGAIWRNLCLNLIIVDNATVEVARLAHKGAREKLVERIRQGIDAALASIAPVLEAYKVARATVLAPVTDEETGVTLPGVESALRGWVNDGTLGLPRRSAEERDRAVAALLTAWKHEPGETLADAVNAVTRSAHSNSWIGVDLRAEMERVASTLLPVLR